MTLLLFDIDGTLLLSGGAGFRALNRAFKEQFKASEAFAGIPVSGRTDPLLLNDAAARLGIALDDVKRRRFHDRYCELLESEILHPGPRKGLMPGVEELLDHLNQRNDISLALLTGNFERSAQIKLEHFGLWHYFRFGAFADDSANRDDLVPVAIGRAEAFGVLLSSSSDVVVIGDTPLDIQCARVANAKSIAVATGSFNQDSLERHGASAVLSDLGDLDAFLAALQCLT